MADTSSLVTAKTCSEEVFNSLYNSLYEKSAAENHAMYEAALRKAKTPSQRKQCAGCYCGRWQTVFNAWVRGKIPNIFIHEALSVDSISESLLLRAE